MVNVIAKKDNQVTINVIGGNSESVTGSCSIINYNGKIALFELGSIQESNDIKTNYNYNKKLVSDIKNKDQIKFVIIGHTHTDHIGNIPSLYRNECNAKIIVPKGSKTILKDMWLDSAYINQKDVESIKYKNKKEVAPLYTENEVYIALNHVVEIDFKAMVELDENLSIRYIPAGHILFSAQTEMFLKVSNCTKKVSFTSDLGNINLSDTKVFIDKFEPIIKTNVLIGECTYSARGRSVSKKDIKSDLQTIRDLVLKYCVKDGKILFIPCFALDKTAYILWLLYLMFSDDTTFVTRIIVDSPLAIKLLKDYAEELQGESKLLFDEMMNWNCIELSKTPMDSSCNMEDGDPKIVLSSSGMLDAGRGIRWAKKILPDKNNCMLFVGYVTQNSNAYRIQNNKSKTIILNGETTNIRSKIVNLRSFSGHMQREDLLNYYSTINADSIYLVHSNKEDKEVFACDLRDKIGKKNKTTKVICVNNKTVINV